MSSTSRISSIPYSRISLGVNIMPPMSAIRIKRPIVQLGLWHLQTSNSIMSQTKNPQTRVKRIAAKE